MSLPQIAGWELQDLIGRGSCGAVYRAVGRDSREACAVKVFSSMAVNRKLLAIAMHGLQRMPEHPGMQRPIAFDFDNSPYYCAMPLVGFNAQDGKGKRSWETPTLESCCGRAPADEAWRYIYEVCDSMAWLHRHNLVHCNLKPRNVLIEDDRVSATRVNDHLQGWVGGVHHFETTDHFMYLAPEQAEHPDALTTHGTGWDVYSFGVLAYRLLTGRFPRAAEVFEEQRGRRDLSGGLVPTVDNAVILQAVRSQPEIHWPEAPTSKWDGKRKEIIEKCLALDCGARWPDVREVKREFEKLEAEFLLEDARERIGLERERQARKLALLRGTTLALGSALFVTGVSGLWYGISKRNRLRQAEARVAEIERGRQSELATRDERIRALTSRIEEMHEEKRLANVNLQMSQEAVDQFLTQLLEIPTGIGLEAEISEKQLQDALGFYEAERRRLKDDAALLPERARNYFNTAQLLLRKQQRAEASDYLEKARSALQILRQQQPGHSDSPRREALLGRASRWLGILKSEAGLRGEALEMFQQAVAALAPALEADPANRTVRMECASAWYELGRRARRDGRITEAIAALEKIPAILNVKATGGALTPQEQFVVVRGRVEQGLALRDSGSTDQAMRSLFDAMEEMVKLVGRQKPSPQREEMALTLAEAYIEFGDIVAAKLGGHDAKEAHGEAMNILMELVRAHPQWGEPRYLLGRSYGAVANIDRDLGNAAEALRRQNLAVESFGELVKLHPHNTRYLIEFARQKGQQAQLLGDLGKAKDSIPVAEDAIASLAGAVKDNATLDVLDRKACGVLLAQLYGILGHSGEVAKNSTLARASFGKAVEQWEKVRAQHGDDDVIQAGLSWTKDRLARMK